MSALKEQLAELLYEELRDLRSTATAAAEELRGYAEVIATEMLTYAAEDPSNERGNLDHLVAQARMIAGMKALQLRDEAWERSLKLLAKGVKIVLAAASG